MSVRITPPSFLRHVTPWRFLYWFDRRSHTCWSGVVMWKSGYGSYSWWPGHDCWDGTAPGHEEGWDYCGKWTAKDAFENEAYPVITPPQESGRR